MNSQVNDRLAGDRLRPEGWPARSGTVPPLAQWFTPRPETGFDLAATPAPGETLVLTPPAQPGAAAGPIAARSSGTASALAVARATGTASPLAGAVGTGTASAAAGTGGTGKTQLAAALARFQWDSAALDLLAWVPAISRDSIITGYVRAGAAVGAPGSGEPPERAAASFLDWLAGTDRPWLLVLDDLTDIVDLDELWPRGQAGRVVVTTRLPATAVRGPGRTIFEVGTFSPREALGYLTARLYPDQRTGGIDLAGDLGCLPLGLALATAVIADTGSDCGQYRAHLAERNRQMSLPQADGYAKIVAATWSISLDLADATGPAGLARAALALVALLDSGGIPGAVLTSRVACEYICGRAAKGTPADESQVQGVLDRLSQVGLVTLDPESAARTVGLHSLVQATARQVIPPAMLEFTADAAASALLQAWAQGDRDPAVAQALRDCAASLHRAAADLLWTPEAHPVLLRAGQSLDRARLPGLAVPYWRAMVGTATRILGPSHASTLLARDHLAAACEAAGRPHDAVAALENSVAERERALGRDHPESLSARGSLARAHLAAGRLDDAIPLYESTLSDQERLLGPDHPDTMAARANLAYAYRSAGRLNDALPLYRRALADRERVLGPDHLHTVTARANLASAYHAMGRRTEAVAVFEAALADCERCLPPGHPMTRAIRENLGAAR